MIIKALNLLWINLVKEGQILYLILFVTCCINILKVSQGQMMQVMGEVL